MLPEGYDDCPMCSTPTMHGHVCDYCEDNIAVNILKLRKEKTPDGFTRYVDPKTGKDAYWRVCGYVARWCR